MKVLIITLYGDFNYGNKFQNYAMQVFLEKQGCEVATITNSSWYRNTKDISQKFSIRLKVAIWNSFFKRVRLHRIKKFKNFSKKYIKQCKYISNTKYDVICIGSDQIWNPYFANKFYYTYGNFADNVFSYAASFGIDDIPYEYKEEVKKGLKHLKKISVREEKGVEIVKNLIGTKAEVHLDPTMLLTSSEWDNIIKEPEKVPKNKYIFTYFLGKPKEELLKNIESIARNRNMEIVDAGQFGNENYYNIDPSEFLYLLKNSEIVFTDSFHGAVFSILYKKIFYVFERENSLVSMNSRLDTLLKKFNLQERKINDYTMKLSLDIDFKNIDEILKKERESSNEYLRKALNIEGNKIES